MHLESIKRNPLTHACAILSICMSIQLPCFNSLGQTPGTLRWQTPIGNNVALAKDSPAIDSHTNIYINSTDGNIYSLAPATGHTNSGWPTNLLVSADSSPAVAPDGTIYVCAKGGVNVSVVLYAITNGAVKWSNAITGGGFSSGTKNNSTPAIASDGTIIVTVLNYQGPGIIAVNPDGSTKWTWGSSTTTNTDDANGFWSAPAIGPDCSIYAIIALNTNSVIAFDENGDVKWETPIPDTGEDTLYRSRIAVSSDGTIYCSAGYANQNPVHLCALRPDGSIKWEFAVSNNCIGTGSYLFNGPVIGSDGTIYAGIMTSLYALDSSGTPKWFYSLTNPTSSITSDPAVASDGTVYFIEDSSILFAVANGVVKWEYLQGTTATSCGGYFDPKSSPVIGPDGTVYYTAVSNNVPYLYAIYGSAAATNSSWSMIFRDPAHSSSVPSTNCSSCFVPYLSGAAISSNTFSFQIGFGPTNSTWNVSQSVDLTNWFSLGEVTLDSSGSGSFTNSNITGLTHQFYKLDDGSCCSKAIGFERVTVSHGSTGSTNSFIADQLEAPVNTLDGLFNPTMPDGTNLPDNTLIQKWNGSQWLTYSWTNGIGWSPNGNATLNPGEAAFITRSGF